MTEQEKRRRRREMERRMRTRAGGRKKEKKSGLMAFRAYVTAILAGGCLLISQFHTETSEMICGKVKEAISMQISMEEMSVWKEKVMAYLEEKNITFPVFLEMEETEEKKVYRPDTEP